MSFGLNDRATISEQIHWMTYHLGRFKEFERFNVCQCPNCGSEFVNVVRSDEASRDYICNGCFQRFKVDIGIAASS